MCCENFALYHNKRVLRADPCCRSVIKEIAHAFSCAYIELWINLGSLEGRSNISSNQEDSFQIFPLHREVFSSLFRNCLPKKCTSS